MFRPTYSRFVPSIDFSNIKNNSLEKILGNAENQTRGCWVRTVNATSVLCPRMLMAVLDCSRVVHVADVPCFWKVTKSKKNSFSYFIKSRSMKAFSWKEGENELQTGCKASNWLLIKSWCKFWHLLDTFGLSLFVQKVNLPQKWCSAKILRN